MTGFWTALAGMVTVTALQFGRGPNAYAHAASPHQALFVGGVLVPKKQVLAACRMCKTVRTRLLVI